MTCRSRWRLLATTFVFLTTFALTLLFTRDAAAQSITLLNSASLPRLDKNGNAVNKRDLTLTPEAVNLQDCLDDQQIQFALTVAGFEASATIEVWASTTVDCSDPLQRSGSTQECWKLTGTNAIATAVTDNIPVRAIMSGVASAITPNATDTICGTVDLSTINIHFLYFPPGITTPGVNTAIQITVDTIGPAAPTGLTILPGNTRLGISWDNISGEGGLTELTGIKVYCDLEQATTSEVTTVTEAGCVDVPNDATTFIDDSGDAETVDAGSSLVCTDGGSSTSAPKSTSCSSPNFVLSDGGTVFPDAVFDSKYLCGNLPGNSGSSATATEIAGKPLVNNTNYAVALAATDKYGNAGPLSAIVCNFPELTTDFWDSYKKDGGKAGGCESTESAPFGTMSVFGIAAFVVASTLRRRRDARANAKRRSAAEKKSK